MRPLDWCLWPLPLMMLGCTVYGPAQHSESPVQTTSSAGHLNDPGLGPAVRALNKYLARADDDSLVSFNTVDQATKLCIDKTSDQEIDRTCFDPMRIDVSYLTINQGSWSSDIEFHCLDASCIMIYRRDRNTIIFLQTPETKSRLSIKVSTTDLRSACRALKQIFSIYGNYPERDSFADPGSTSNDCDKMASSDANSENSGNQRPLEDHSDDSQGRYRSSGDGYYRSGGSYYHQGGSYYRPGSSLNVGRH